MGNLWDDVVLSEDVLGDGSACRLDAGLGGAAEEAAR